MKVLPLHQSREGVDHEFSPIKGVVEDVEIVLNLKQIRFKQQIEDENSEKVQIKFGGNNQLKQETLVRI